MSSNAKLPHWDMNAIYPGLESAEFEAGFQTAIAAIDALVEQFDAHGILLRETPPPIDEETRATFETILASYNAVAVQGHTLYAYLSNLISTDSFNESAQARLSELQRHYVKMGQLYTRLTAWLGSLDVEALIAASPLAEAHAFALRQAAELAQHLMSPEEEALAAQLRLTGSGAWAKLYNNYTSQITVPLDIAGQPPTLPITAVRNLAYNPDRAIRQAAYQAELDAWKRHALPIASALNSIKGELLTLAERRRWDSPLDIALFNNNTDHETLDAMLTAAREFFPDFRRYLRAKARVLGVPQLAWYDLFAPVGESKQTWEFPQARAFIEEQFGAYSDQLAALARRAFEEHWIDAEPRDGKRGGAFCAWMRGGESRILANFQPAYGGMGTLAHELGHAYHNLARAGCTYIQRQTPMTLAETASNFCEALIQEAALAQAP
ncbi:MAG TPA: oligoendopeptidase F, partial [Chloroflexi bacterium]|nr:oligoendopeptidase F [Chloroflexota bacterium]